MPAPCSSRVTKVSPARDYRRAMTPARSHVPGRFLRRRACVAACLAALAGLAGCADVNPHPLPDGAFLV